MLRGSTNASIHKVGHMRKFLFSLEKSCLKFNEEPESEDKRAIFSLMKHGFRS